MYLTITRRLLLMHIMPATEKYGWPIHPARNISGNQGKRSFWVLHGLRFYVSLRKGIPNLFESKVNFDYLEFGIEQEIKLGLVGISTYSIRTGSFFNTKDLRLVDYKWQRRGDPLLFMNPHEAFQSLDSTFAVFKRFYQGHFLHEFNGAFINKIPILKSCSCAKWPVAVFCLRPSVHYDMWKPMPVLSGFSNGPSIHSANSSWAFMLLVPPPISSIIRCSLRLALLPGTGGRINGDDSSLRDYCDKCFFEEWNTNFLLHTPNRKVTSIVILLL